VETAARSRTDPAQEGVERVLYRYNSGGERMGEFAVDSEGEAIAVRLSAFDSNGRRTAEARYHLCRTFSSLDLYTYDEGGRLAVELRFESRRLSKREFQYGENGTLQRVCTHRNGVYREPPIITMTRPDTLRTLSSNFRMRPFPPRLSLGRISKEI